MPIFPRSRGVMTYVFFFIILSLFIIPFLFLLSLHLFLTNNLCKLL